ncbi:ARPP-1 family domain-containing protein [candidate division KSB1 bacterium]
MQLNEACVDFALGKPQAYKNLTIVPIQAKRGGKKSELDYIVLNEGLKNGSVHIQETGDVNKLWISNNSDKDLLVLKGEYVVGGKQNRMVTVNGLIAAHTGRMYIPVHCVQHGRWDSPKGFGLADFAASVSLRSRVTKSASGQGGQSETWNEVKCFLGDAGVRSSSENFDDAYKGRRNDTEEYLKSFTKERGQLGAIAIVGYRNGQTHAFVDMFDQAGTFTKHYERILGSYAIDAAVQGVDVEVNVSKADAEKFLSAILNAPTTESQSICLGSDYEINDGRVQGAGLVYEGTMVYLGAKDYSERREGYTPPPSFPGGGRRPGPRRPDRRGGPRGPLSDCTRGPELRSGNLCSGFGGGFSTELPPNPKGRGKI